MSGDDLKQRYIHVTEAFWNAGTLEVLDDALDPDVVSHISGQPGLRGLMAYKERVAKVRTAFPDFHVTLDEVIGEGDTIATRWTIQSTYTGPEPSMPVPPTGKRATFTGTWVGHFRDGKLVEDWYTYDTLDFLQQLGAMPPLTHAVA